VPSIIVLCALRGCYGLKGVCQTALLLEKKRIPKKGSLVVLHRYFGKGVLNYSGVADVHNLPMRLARGFFGYVNLRALIVKEDKVL